jgi:hypothetical protein
MCAQCPEALVSAPMWRLYHDIWATVFNDPYFVLEETAGSRGGMAPTSISTRFRQIQLRNETLLCLAAENLPPTAMSATMADVEVAIVFCLVPHLICKISF